jgi:hypothetical protein
MNFKYKIIGYLAVILILYFLINNLVTNWFEVSHYDFSFDYTYLLISLALLVVSLSLFPLVWRLIIKSLDKNCLLTPNQAIKIYLTSEFGKYIPGKVWAVAGKVYLAAQYGLSKKMLLISSFLDAVLAVTGTLIIGLIFFISYLNILTWQIYSIALSIILIVLIIIQPKVFYSFFNYVLVKFKREPIAKEHKLSYSHILKFAFFYLIIAFIHGLAFVMFVFSITHLNLNQLPLIIGSFNLAKGLGVAALFAPSGLGIREGVLTLGLGVAFSSTIAILISLLARLWVTLGEILAYLIALILNKLKPE